MNKCGVCEREWEDGDWDELSTVSGLRIGNEKIDDIEFNICAPCSLALAGPIEAYAVFANSMSRARSEKDEYTYWRDHFLRVIKSESEKEMEMHLALEMDVILEAEAKATKN